MKATNLKGFFDVRVYAEGKEREACKMKADDETIYFVSRFTPDTCPDDLRPYVTEYVSKKDGSTNFRLKFKVGGRAAWYAPSGAPCARPTNAELEGDRWQVSLDFVNIPADPANPKKPCGLWVNAIQAMRLERYEFAPMVDTSAQQTTPSAPISNGSAPAADEDPFA